MMSLPWELNWEPVFPLQLEQSHHDIIMWINGPDLADSAPSLLMEEKSHILLLVQLCWQSV